MFPLRSVMPICVRVTGWLKTKEDREDAIQDALEDILRYPVENMPQNEVEALIAKISYSRACAIYRKNVRLAKYLTVFKTIDTCTGELVDCNKPVESIPKSFVWINERQLEAEDWAYKRAIGRQLYKKLKLCTSKQQTKLLLLMAGCSRREINWVLGKTCTTHSASAFDGARSRVKSALDPDLRKEIEDQYRGNRSKGGRRPKPGRKFYEDSSGVQRYTRPGTVERLVDV